MLDPLNLPKLTPKSKIFGGPEKGDFFFSFVSFVSFVTLQFSIDMLLG